MGFLQQKRLCIQMEKSGVIYRKDDLTAVAATDKEGNAAFLAYTEAPHTVLNTDGTIKAPEDL